MNIGALDRVTNKLQKEQHLILDEIVKAYQKLELEYHFSLFIGGFCLIWYFDYVNWLTGIGWLFLSKFISLIITRIDVINYTSSLLKLHKEETSSSFKPWMN